MIFILSLCICIVNFLRVRNKALRTILRALLNTYGYHITFPLLVYLLPTLLALVVTFVFEIII
nr:MAG TPA: hypothetical protein [Caudoviricetes sp.]